ncbi:MAG: LD-carboxypeptidase [Lachnospiraceae bacterium]|nr:LD-carboxypeptidase [Lachnospiraceae bacterium]
MGKKVGIVCCSNGQLVTYREEINNLLLELQSRDIEPVLSDYIYSDGSVVSGSAEERANALMDFYKDDLIMDIYDISGGDIANEVLPYLDFDIIRKSGKIFYGYSDLTTVINGIYSMTGNESVLYQVKNLVWDKTGTQKKQFLSDEMFKFDYEFINHASMKGILVGGNIRCLLKLAGTKFFPDMNNKILLLEAFSGLEPQIRTYFAQLAQLGVFKKVNGVLLGTFTEMDKRNKTADVINVAREYIGCEVPLAKTNDIGHSSLSKAVVIGREYFFINENNN